MNSYSHVIADPYDLLVKLDYEDGGKDTKIVGKEIRLQPHKGALYDLSFNASGPMEDELVAASEFLRQNIRRGNSFIQIWDRDGQVQKTFTARKGLRKFFDLSREYIEYNLGVRNSLKGTKNTQSDVDFHRIIFSDLKEALKSGFEVKAYSMVKANGENAQVSYVDELDSWLIASKNVSLLARKPADLALYRPYKTQETDRYQYACLMGATWFDILDRMDPAQVENLKKDLTNRTIIGEYCGNQNYQHLVKYEYITIYWFAVVDNDSLQTECVDIKTSQDFFKHYKLDTCPISELGTFNSFHSLNYFLLKYFDEIARSRIEVSHEGAVLYFEAQQGSGLPKVVSLAKLKTLEYRIYRKLREKLRSYLSKEYASEQLLVDRFMKEVRELSRDVKPPKPLSYYEKVANKALDFIVDFRESTYLIHEHYISFLSVVMYALSHDVKITLNHFKEDFVKQLLKEPWSDFSQPKKQVIALIPVGIPGMGKSTLFQSLQNYILNTYSDANVQILSMDKIRNYLINVERDRNKTLNNEQLYERTRTESTLKYKKEIEKVIDGFRQQSTFSTFFLLLDKNHPIDALEIQIKDLKSKSAIDLEILTVAVFPKSLKEFHITDSKVEVSLPFSLNFAMTCIARVQSRKQHETLKGNGTQSLRVVFNFIKLFNRKRLESVYSDHDIHYQYVEETENSDKQYSIVARKDFITILQQKEPETYQLEDFLESSEKEQVKSENIEESVLAARASKIVEDIIFKFKLTPQPKLRLPKEKKGANVTFGSKTTSPPPNYIGIEVFPEETEKVKLWIQKAITDELQRSHKDKKEKLQLFSNRIDEAKPKSLHLTSLFIGNQDKAILQSKYYTSFEVGKQYTLNLDYVVMIPDKLCTVAVQEDSKLPPIENEYPHITLYVWKQPELVAKHSNDLLEAVGPLRKDESFYSMTVKIQGKSYMAYVLVPSKLLDVRGTSKEWPKVR